MDMHLLLSLPFTDPVIVFTIVLIIILISPLVLKYVRIPSIIGLIIAGVAVGPKGFNLLSRDASIELFGTVGLLYLMFIAGLEIDLQEFRKNRKKSLIFGLLTFSVPMIIGTFTALYLLKMDLRASILMASMFASHTLLTYPVMRKLGLINNEAVVVAVGGTVITDVLALMILAVIAGMEKGEITLMFWIKLSVSVILFFALMIYGLPRLARWFFKNVENDGEVQYIFVMTMVFISALLAKAAGIEPIIGAFLAGLSLNSFIPSASPLMNRIGFVGNALFIPFFLISVGMLVDIRVLFEGTGSWFVAGLMIMVAVSAKWIAAYLTQQIFSYSSYQRDVIFSLSNSQAAATLAAVIIAFELGLFSFNILNGTVIMILVTCLISSFVAETAGRKMATGIESVPIEPKDFPEKILVPVSEASDIQPLLDLALMLKKQDSDTPIFSLKVFREEANSGEQIMRNDKMLSDAVTYASAAESAVRTISRIDSNVANGIIRAVRELLITVIILGWDGRYSSHYKIFGNILDRLLSDSSQMILVCKINNPLNTIKRIVVVAPPFSEYEKGFCRWLESVKQLSKQAGASLLFLSRDITNGHIKKNIESSRPAVDAEYLKMSSWRDLFNDEKIVQADDLIILVSARRGTISWHKNLDKFPKLFARFLPRTSFIIIYPEQ